MSSVSPSSLWLFATWTCESLAMQAFERVVHWAGVYRLLVEPKARHAAGLRPLNDPVPERARLVACSHLAFSVELVGWVEFRSERSWCQPKSRTVFEVLADAVVSWAWEALRSSHRPRVL
jgi:hypothetical protein